MTDQTSLKRQLTTKTRRLNILKERQSLEGLATPPHVIIEIEDLEAEIEVLQAQLAALDAEESPPAVAPSPPPGPVPDNPFYTGGRINQPGHFFGRQRLLREIRAELGKRSSVSLVGPLQMGKSSLLYHLYATRREWLPDVSLAYIDLQGVLDEADFCETVLAELGSEGEDLRQLKRVLARREVILLFDEMERLAEPDFNPRLHDLLRALAQEPHFAMCLATRRPLVDLFPARSPGGVSPFHNIFTVKALPPFTEADARAFLSSRLAPTGLSFTEAEIERLLSHSQGHPATLQALAKALFAEKVGYG